MKYLKCCIIGSIMSLLCFAENYQVCNLAGDTLVYSIRDNKAYLEPCGEYSNYIKSDSLVIPDSIAIGGVKFPVVGAPVLTFATIPTTTTSITLPETWVEMPQALISPYIDNHCCNYYVDDNNPVLSSKDGILYTKSLKTLISYPTGRNDSVVSVNERVDSLYKSSFFHAVNITHLELPLTLKYIGLSAMCDMNNLHQVILKDSITTLESMAIGGEKLNTIIIGSGLQQMHAQSVQIYNQHVNIYLYAITPPMLTGTYTKSDNIVLYVPSKCLNSYRYSEDWQNFAATILPIEPPIVTGMDTASISWVQNFSATGYVWTLYTDEAKTQRFMSLTFDANGHLTHIDINSGHIPARMTELVSEDGDEEQEKRFAEYYSFTISGLDTRYYYTRQSLAGNEVIDEETGSFETLGNGTTALEDSYLDNNAAPQKFIKDGQVLIHNQNATYNVVGTNITQ